MLKNLHSPISCLIFTLLITTNKTDMTLTAIINKIEVLENKRDNGTMTMDEETLFMELVDKAEQLIYA